MVDTSFALRKTLSQIECRSAKHSNTEAESPPALNFRFVDGDAYDVEITHYH